MLSEVYQLNALYYPPENRKTLSIHTDAGNYVDTWENFILDSGLGLPSVPDNVLQRVYIQGIRHDFMDRNDPNKVVKNEPMPWDIGDQAIANIVAILNAQHIRRVPPGGLMQVKAARSNEIHAESIKVINGEFTSSALGSPHLYSGAPAARADLTASVTVSLLPDTPSDWTTPFWCADADGKEALRDHTASQIQQVSKDCQVMTDAAKEKLAKYLTQIDQAQDDNAVGAVAWSG